MRFLMCVLLVGLFYEPLPTYKTLLERYTRTIEQHNLRAAGINVRAAKVRQMYHLRNGCVDAFNKTYAPVLQSILTDKDKGMTKILEDYEKHGDESQFDAYKRAEEGFKKASKKGLDEYDRCIEKIEKKEIDV